MKRKKSNARTLKIRRVLLTGATGHLGRSLVPALLHRGYKLRVLARDSEALKTLFPKHWRSLEIVRTDLSKIDLAALQKAVAGCQVVVHAAGVIRGSAKQVFDVNANATAALAIAARRARVSKFIFISSVAVYRDPVVMPVDEAHPYSYASAYGESKALGEQAVKDSKVQFITLRPAAIYGPSFDWGFESIVRGIQKGRMPIIGNGNNRIPLVFEDDVVAAVLAALETKMQNKEYNIVGDGLWTQKQLFHEVARLLGAPAPRVHVPKMAAAVLAAASEALAHIHGHSPKLSSEAVAFLTEDRDYSNEAAKRELGWRPRVRLAEGLKRAVEALQA